MMLFARFFSIAALLALPVWAELSPQEVLKSAQEHYPAILEALAEQQEADAARQRAEGAFDATIEQDISNRATGFYDGRQISTQIVKPVPFMSGQFYGGYRISEGNFPIYEDILYTNEDGEVAFGAQLSLLRDRMIDERRANVTLAEIDSEIAKIDVLLAQVGVQQQALARYWMWVAKGKKIRILEDILSLMEKRQEALDTRVSRGDVAQIFLTENMQNIRRRQSQIVLAQQEFQEAANRLSLYFRDNSGAPVVPPESDLPADFPLAEHRRLQGELAELLVRHPLIERINRQRGKAQQNLALGENLLLPRADVLVEVSEDMGGGSITRQDTETVMKLSVSIPLQTNEAEGRIRQAKARMKQLDYQARLERDTLQIQLNNLLALLDNAAQNIALTNEEVALASKMVSAERERFKKGDSDFFLINMREEMLANASLSNVVAKARYQQACAELYLFTLNESQPCEAKE